MGYDELLPMYEDLGARRKRHQLSFMYRHYRNSLNIDVLRLNIELRSSNKLKFKAKTTQLIKKQNGPYHRGVSLQDRLPVNVQRAMTKVKFKQ